MLQFLEFNPELQQKYNGYSSNVHMIEFMGMVIMKFLVKPSSRVCDVAVLDIGRMVTMEEMENLGKIKTINNKHLFMQGQKYGLDIFNLSPMKRPIEDFKQTSIAIASFLSHLTGEVVKVCFCSNKLYDVGIHPR